MLKPGVRVIEAHVHIGSHPLRLDRMCYQPTLAGIKGAAVPSDPERLDLPLIPAPPCRSRRLSTPIQVTTAQMVGLHQSFPSLTPSDGPPIGLSPHLAALAIPHPHYAMLTGTPPAGLPPVMSVFTSIFTSHLGHVSLGVVGPRFSSGAVRSRLVGRQSVRVPRRLCSHSTALRTCWLPLHGDDGPTAAIE
jgi:hypothetical protein